MGDLRVIKISEIRENPVALRTVNRTSESYLGLVQSIKNKSFFGAITVRPKTDEETKEAYYELVDGLHRFSAAKDAGLEEINVDVVSLDDDQVLEAQIMANIHKVETRPVEYSQQLRRILARNPLMTSSELASKLGKSSAWITQRLSLNKILNEEIKKLVDEGKIKLMNAYSLSKLPPEEMPNYVDRAVTESPEIFVPQIDERVKEIKDAKRKGKDSTPAVFKPIAFLQKLKDIKAEKDVVEVGGRLCEGLSTALDGWNMAVSWMMHLDPESVAVQKSKDDERKAERVAAKAKRDVKKEKEKLEKAEKVIKEAAEAAEAAKAALA